MNRLIPLYPSEPEKLQALHAALSEQHQSLFDAQEPSGPAQHAAHCGDWKLVLDAGENGELLEASMIRCGTERYNFERTGSSGWSGNPNQSLFAETHFYNLVQMATRRGLEWTAGSSPA